MDDGHYRLYSIEYIDDNNNLLLLFPRHRRKRKWKKTIRHKIRRLVLFTLDVFGVVKLSRSESESRFYTFLQYYIIYII